MKNFGKKAGRHAALLAAVLLLACAGGVFAQDAEEAAPSASAGAGKPNGIYLDIMPTLKGFVASYFMDHGGKYEAFTFAISLGYERLVIPHLSAGAAIDLMPGQFKIGKETYPIFGFGMAATCRYYIMSPQMERWFVGFHLGFNLLSVDGSTNAYSNKSGDTGGGYVGLTTGVNTGFRIPLGGMFFIEPSIGYNYAKSSTLPIPTTNGFQGGLKLGVTI